VDLNDDQIENERPGHEATSKSFKAWQSCAATILTALAERYPVREEAVDLPAVPQLYPPLLSICVTTYNRAPWLKVSLQELTKLISVYSDVVELVVCDNASSDDTPSVAARYDGLSGFRYFRNPVNVGMLGNLRETVHHARGRFIWLLGDDDIVKPGALEKILSVILEHPSISLIYLNYAYTHHNAPRTIEGIGEFISSAIPITPATEDRCASISEISTLSENFFTAIYCLIFRRDHAIRAYSQDTAGRPFSSLLTCIPTASYVCNSMFAETGYWIGRPWVVVNMNVSWMKYAPLWRLERLPELYELAEMRGAAPKGVDRWRVHNLQGASEYLHDIYFNDPEGNRLFFSFEGFIRRHKHLPEFRSELGELMQIYRQAYAQGLGERPPTELLSRFDLAVSRQHH
jgi:glycosyltransferase involved in cell wall biosynthesis